MAVPFSFFLICLVLQSPIGQTVHFLAKQNIPLRAHHDDSQCLELEHVNTGNFQELLKFHCEAGDIYLKQHFELGNKNATNRSKRIQNQIIEILGDQVLEGIIANVKAAKYFAVSADEATDRGLQSQCIMLMKLVSYFKM